jgi:hypothetical protein
VQWASGIDVRHALFIESRLHPGNPPEPRFQLFGLLEHVFVKRFVIGTQPFAFGFETFKFRRARLGSARLSVSYQP